MENKSLNFFEAAPEINKRTEQILLPSSELEALVEEFIFIQCEKGIDLETLPSSSVSLDFTLKGAITMLGQDNELNINLPKSVAFGVTTRSFKFKFAENTTLFVVKFKPGWAGAIINLPINKMFEKFIPLDEIFNKSKISFISKQLKKQGSFEEIVRFMEEFLINEMRDTYKNEIIREAIDFIKEERGLIPIKSLVEELCLDRTLFDKMFKIQVGTTPKQYSNIIRFRSLFETINLEESLIQIGLNAGYYDQAHFIKNFKSITGRTPSEVI